MAFLYWTRLRPAASHSRGPSGLVDTGLQESPRDRESLALKIASRRNRTQSPQPRPRGREPLSHLLACPEQPGRDRCLAHAQCSCGFLVREAEHVHGHQHKATILRKPRNRGVYLLHLKCLLGLAQLPRIGGVDVLERGHGHRSSARGATAREERVAQHAHQVVQIVVAGENSGPRQHPRKRLLHQVLGVLARAAQRPRGAIEPIHVLRQRLWVQSAHWRWRKERILRAPRCSPRSATVAPTPIALAPHPPPGSSARGEGPEGKRLPGVFVSTAGPLSAQQDPHAPARRRILTGVNTCAIY